MHEHGGVRDLAAFASLVPLDHGLVVVSTARADGTVQSSVEPERTYGVRYGAG
jgi:hypothetical protein